MSTLNRTKENPWQLKTPPGASAYTMHLEEKEGKRVLACTVGKTVLLYDARCIDDLHAMLKATGALMSRNPPRKALSKHGRALRIIPLVVGTV